MASARLTRKTGHLNQTNHSDEEWASATAFSLKVPLQQNIPRFNRSAVDVLMSWF
jgi:hypothetical protein